MQSSGGTEENTVLAGGEINTTTASQRCDDQPMDELPTNTNYNNAEQDNTMDLDPLRNSTNGSDGGVNDDTKINNAARRTTTESSTSTIQPVFKDVTFNYDKNLLDNQWGNEHLEKKIHAQVVELQKLNNNNKTNKIPTDSRARVLARRIVNGMRSDYNTQFLWKIPSNINPDNNDDGENNFKEIQYDQQLEFVSQLLLMKCKVFNYKDDDDTKNDNNYTNTTDINIQDNLDNKNNNLLNSNNNNHYLKHSHDNDDTNDRNQKIKIGEEKEN